VPNREAPALLDVALHVLPDPGLEAARLDQDHPHARRGDLDPQGVRERLEPVLRRRVPAGQGRGGEAGDRRDVHDAALPPFAHPGQHELGQAHGGDDHGLEELAGLVVVDVLDGAGDAVAGVVHEPVQVEAGHRLGARLRVGDVELDGADVDPGIGRGLGHDLRLGLGADRPDRVEAPAGELEDGLEADAGVGAGDEDGSSQASIRTPDPPGCHTGGAALRQPAGDG
jgi:hypothetical protein